MSDVLSRVRKTPLPLIVGIVMMALVVLAAFIAPVFVSGAANELSDEVSQSPSAAHWLGTDAFGRDILSRSLVAARMSLIMAAAATVIIMAAGALVGTVIWLLPRKAREACLRVIEIAVSYPELLLAIVLAAILGTGSVQLTIAIAVANIPSMARLVSNLTAKLIHQDFVSTARLLGVPKFRLVTRHLMPNIGEPLFIQTATTFAGALVAMSALSFVGLGIVPPEYDLGRELAASLPSIYTRPHEVMGPALLIVVISFSAILIGDGLAGLADPRTRERLEKAKRSRGGEPKLDRGPGDFVSVDDLRITKAGTGGRELVKGVSFSVAPGEILGIVGESGSGKSLSVMALADLLAQGLHCEANALRIGELDMLGKNDPATLAKTIGLVYQDPGTTFNPAFTMGAQLGEVLTTHLGLSKAEAKEKLVAALTTARITDPERLLRSYPHQLSGGMKQRAMIAATLAQDPALIIADEPTTALDVTVQAEILRELKRINAETGTSMLFISHDLGVIGALADRIIVMRQGEIVETLTQEQLRTGEVSHEYTALLLASVPTIRTEEKPREIERKRRSIENPVHTEEVEV